MTEATYPVDILLVEDNLGDVRLTMEAFKQTNLRRSFMHVVHDGEEALAFLKRQGKYANVPRPDLVLLDLNLPRKDGREVLAAIKSDDALKRIPVVVLSTSRSEQDILKSYNLHANSYISKPVDLEQFWTVVRGLDHFWLQLATLPPK